MPTMNYSQPQGAVKNGRDDEMVQKALFLITNMIEPKREYDSRNQAIATLLDEGFDVHTPTGAKKITAQMLQQAMWRTMNKMKPLDFQLHGTGRPEAIEKIMTYGLSFLCEKTGLVSGLRDKNGVFWGQLMYGDGFFVFGANPDQDSEIPLIFNPVPNSNVYFDQYATAVRAGGYGRSATEALVVFSMSWEQATKLYPKLKKNGVSGTIPRELDSKIEAETGRSYTQSTKMKDVTEIGYYYNIEAKEYCVFGGAACTVLDKVKGEKYPFFKDGKPYIPVGQFMAMPAARGFFNHGLGSMLYRWALLSRKMVNMVVGHVEDSIYPITLLNLPQGEASSFLNAMREAAKGRQNGKKPIVPIEYDPTNPNSGRVQAQSLLTQSALNEYQFLYEQMTREIRRLGINLDDIEKGENVTATQIIAEEENSNAFVKQIMEYCASESQFILEVILDTAKKFISKKDKTVINMPVKIKIGEELNVRMDTFTLGDFVDELSKHKYFIKVNARSGAIPSNVMRQAQISRVLPFVQPGTPAYIGLVDRIAELNDTELDTSSMQPQPPALPPQGGVGQIPESILPTETDTLEINSRTRKNPIPAF